MANRRMFSLQIIDTDLFLDMSLSAQALYFHLSMRADDDGFVSNPKKIARMIGSNDDDMKFLIGKQFILPFENGVCVIKHWRIHNYIQKDRYNPTFYKLEKSMLEEHNGTYELMDTTCIQPVVQNVHKLLPQVRLGKVRLGKVRDRLFLDKKTSKDVSRNKFQPIIEAWNSLKLSQIKSISSNREKMLNARIKEYSLEDILKAIESIKTSSFLKGQNNRSWIITFDWFIKPNNFPKVLEGNYIDKEDNNGSPKQNHAASEIESKYGKGWSNKYSKVDPNQKPIGDIDF